MRADVPDHFKTQEMCATAVKLDPFSLIYVPDWFVTQQQIESWDEYCNDDIIKWHNGYQKRKVQKEQIKEELMPIAWLPSRWWDWCLHEDEKKETEKLWVQIWAFLYLVTGYKKFFDQKELQIKISLSVQSSVVES